jgi:hypothetical protein
MSLCAFVLQYKGYTSISQVSGANVNAALERWSKNLSASKAKDLPPYRRQIAAELRSSCPVPVDTVSNVWCASGSVRGHLALLNIVLTER